MELARSSLDEQERKLKHFEEEREKMEKTLDKSKLFHWVLFLMYRNYTKADDVDLDKTISLSNVNLTAVEEKKQEVKMDKNIDFNALLGGKKEEVKEEVKEESKEEGKKDREASRDRSSHHRRHSRDHSHHHHHHSRERSREYSRHHHSRERSRERSRDQSPAKETPSNEFSYQPTDNHKDHWLVPGLEVKIMNSQLGNGLWIFQLRLMNRLFKKKGKVVSLFDAYTAKVKPYESDFSIRIDQVRMERESDVQDELQTVIPKEGEEALVVNGPLVKCRVRVVKIHKEEDFCEAVIVGGENA